MISSKGLSLDGVNRSLFRKNIRPELDFKKISECFFLSNGSSYIYLLLTEIHGSKRLYVSRQILFLFLGGTSCDSWSCQRQSSIQVVVVRFSLIGLAGFHTKWSQGKGHGQALPQGGKLQQ